jgi:hypothetical protein
MKDIFEHLTLKNPPQLTNEEAIELLHDVLDEMSGFIKLCKEVGYCYKCCVELTPVIEEVYKMCPECKRRVYE